MNSKTRPQHWRNAPARRLAVALVVCWSAWGLAFNKPWKWTTSTQPSYPVVPIHSCPSAFQSFFPGFSWSNIRGHALSAANEWFAHGNADIRLRVRGDLSGSDPRCTPNSGSPNAGEVLLVAESGDGTGTCRWGATFWSWQGQNEINSAKVVLYRNCRTSWTSCG